MTKLAGRYRKAIGAFCSQLLVWGGVVVASPSGPITSAEWLGLGGVAFSTLVVAWVAANDPAPAP